METKEVLELKIWKVYINETESAHAREKGKGTQ
jgi:hypothetical protein